VTHTYIQAIKQPTLGYLTRSVRRRAATSKRRNRKSEFSAKTTQGKSVTFGVTRGCIAVASPVSSITWLIAP
jgi:hypothetical protein